jgi:hypothetical protein
MDVLVVAVIALVGYWIGWAIGRRDWHEAPPWPESEDCEALPPLHRRLLPYLPTHDQQT